MLQVKINNTRIKSYRVTVTNQGFNLFSGNWYYIVTFKDAQQKPKEIKAPHENQMQQRTQSHVNELV